MRFTRRRFVQSSLLSAIATANLRSVHAAADDRPLRIGAIGVGNRGFDNLLALSTESIVALCDVDQRYLAKAHERFPQARTYQDYRQLFDTAELDAVVVSTPDHSHAPAVLRALRQNLHVYCEKPLAHNLHELTRITNAANASAATTQMGNHHQSSDGYQRAIQWLREGRLGKVSAVHCWTDRPLWPQGIPRPEDRPAVPDYLHWELWLGPAPETPYHPAYHPLTWRGWWSFGTGALGDMLPHLLDPVVSGLNLQAPARVEAESSEVLEHSAPTWSRVRFDFAAEEGHSLPVHWYDGNQQPDPKLLGVERLPPSGCFVQGSEANLFIPELGRAPLLLAPSGKRIQSDSPRPTGARPTHHVQWIAACKGQAKPSSPFEYGARLTRIALLGNLAIRAGQAIEWDAEQQQPRPFPGADRLLKNEYREGWDL